MKQFYICVDLRDVEGHDKAAAYLAAMKRFRATMRSVGDSVNPYACEIGECYPIKVNGEHRGIVWTEE